jgi:hypothetical protein
VTGERRPLGVGRLVVDNLQDGRGAEVELVKEEIVWVDDLQVQRFKCPGGKVRQVRGDDGVRASPDRGGDDVPVILVRQGNPGLEFFPAPYQRVVECLTHGRESLGGVCAGPDLGDDCLCLGKDSV